MHEEEDYISLPEVAAATRYPIDAFHFVRRGLDYTVHRIHANPELLEEGERHVTGQQLSEGLRDFALDQYGRLARMMLERWNIHRTDDFGRIVFAMVDAQLMQASEGDSVADFENAFDFDTAFVVEVSTDDVPLDADADAGAGTSIDTA